MPCGVKFVMQSEVTTVQLTVPAVKHRVKPSAKQESNPTSVVASIHVRSPHSSKVARQALPSQKSTFGHKSLQLSEFIIE